MKLAVYALAIVLGACGGGPALSTSVATTEAANPTTTAAGDSTTSVYAEKNESPGPSSTTLGATTTVPPATNTTRTTTTSTTPTSTTTSTTTTAPATTTSASSGQTVSIGVSNFAFAPNMVNVKVGDTVQWNLNDGSHTSTSGTPPQSDGRWNQVLSPDGPFAVTFEEAGKFAYFCRFHPDFMQGTVVVAP
ncbi:MAG: cupredoxin domain-containing protein [Actinomycetota bacterium]